MYKQVEWGEPASFPASISELLPQEYSARSFDKVVERLDLSVLKESYSRDLGRLFGHVPIMLWILGANRAMETGYFHKNFVCESGHP